MASSTGESGRCAPTSTMESAPRAPTSTMESATRAPTATMASSPAPRTLSPSLVAAIVAFAKTLEEPPTAMLGMMFAKVLVVAQQAATAPGEERLAAGLILGQSRRLL